MSGRPRPQAFGRVGIGERRADSRLECAKVALSDRVLVRRVGHRFRVLGDEVLGDRFDFWAVKSRLVVSVPALDGTGREPMLESAPDVLHRRGNLGRRTVDEEREEELRAITITEVHHSREAVRPRARHARADVGVDAVAEAVISARGRPRHSPIARQRRSAARRCGDSGAGLLGLPKATATTLRCVKVKAAQVDAVHHNKRRTDTAVAAVAE